MKRLIAVATLAALVIAFVPGAAQARSDKWTYLETEDYVDDVSCPFAIQTHFVVDQAYVKSFYDGDTWVRDLITGRLVMQLTNLEQPDHMATLNVSGPAQVYPTETGFIQMSFGRSLLYTYPTGVLLGTGLWIITVDTSGSEWTWTDNQIGGTQTDLCAALA